VQSIDYLLLAHEVLDLVSYHEPIHL